MTLNYAIWLWLRFTFDRYKKTANKRGFFAAGLSKQFESAKIRVTSLFVFHQQMWNMSKANIGVFNGFGNSRETWKTTIEAKTYAQFSNMRLPHIQEKLMIIRIVDALKLWSACLSSRLVQCRCSRCHPLIWTAILAPPASQDTCAQRYATRQSQTEFP